MPWSTEAPPLPAGDLAVLVNRGDPVLRSGRRPPDELLHAALDAAADVAVSAAEADREAVFDFDTWGENGDTDAVTEAWLRVDEAEVLAALAIAPRPDANPVSVDVQRRAAAGSVPPGELHLHVPGTGETHRVRVFDNTGAMRPDAVREVSWALRDRRADRARTMEPRLITMLYLVGQYYDSELVVVSGYRIRGVNATNGSRHGSARACDFRIQGVGTRTLARHVERAFERVGVGYYPTSAFVHLDARRRSYFWIDRSAPGQRSRTRSRTVEIRAEPGSDVTVASPHVTEAQLYVPPPFEE